MACAWPRGPRVRGPAPRAHCPHPRTPALAPPQALTAATLSALADLVSQRIVGQGPIRWRRTVLLALYGLVWSGPAAHYWQGYLERLFPNKDDPLRLLKKVAVDQLVYAPIQTTVVLTYLAKVVEGLPLSVALSKVAAQWSTVQSMGWRVRRGCGEGGWGRTCARGFPWKAGRAERLGRCRGRGWRAPWIQRRRGTFLTHLDRPGTLGPLLPQDTSDGVPTSTPPPSTGRRATAIHTQPLPNQPPPLPQFWPLVQYINQKYLPLQLRVLWLNCVAFLWGIFVMVKSRAATAPIAIKRV